MEAVIPSKMIRMFNNAPDSHAELAAGEAAASAFESAPGTHGITPSAEAAASTPVLVTSETDGSIGGFRDRLLSCSLPSVPVLPSTEGGQLFHEVQDSGSSSVTIEAHAHSNSRVASSALLPSSHGRLPEAIHNIRFMKNNTSLHRQRLYRSCRMPDVGAGAAASPGKQPRPPERQPPIRAGNEAHSASAYQKTRSSWDAAVAAPSLASAGHHQNANLEGKSNTRERQLATSPSRAIAASQMTKSVSPAGVVRIGGRNRRKRTKYDLAYKQMEQLGRFEEEVKSIDLSKVSGSNFVLKLLSNPQQYSYESWKYGCSWPVGADGRRLLLRKLRGVYWSNPEKWQRVLEQHNLYRRDLFTLATVQDLFKVTHLMGAEAWDFLLKCTALTQKCDALSSKDVDIGEDEPLEAPSVPDTARRASEAPGARACQSEEELYSNSFLGSALPCPGYSRKRVACGGGEHKGLSKRRRGRPRNASLKTERRSFGLAEAGNMDPAESGDAAVLKRETSTGWMNDTEAFSHVANEPEPLPRSTSAGHAACSQALSMEGQSESDQIAQNASVQSSGSQGLASASQRSSGLTSGLDWCYSGRGALAKSLALGLDSRLLGGGKTNGGMLRLATHYTFMAQFMQCCMLVEVQRTLLRLAKGFKPSFPAEREFSQACPERAVKKADLTAQACLDSLVQSSNTHLEFVQVIVQQLCLQGDLDYSVTSPEQRSSVFKGDDEFLSIMRQLRLLCQKSISSLTASGAHYPAFLNDQRSPDLRMLLWREQQSSNQPSEGDLQECLFPISKGKSEHSATPKLDGEAKQCIYPPSEVHAEQCLTMASEAAHQEQCLSPASEQEQEQCLTPAAAPRRLHSGQRGEGEEDFEAGNSRAAHVISGASRMLYRRERALQRQPDGVTT
ncbi:hypothetical protein Emag_003890 [Eimeria magna]